MYEITVQQYENLNEALKMWATVPPENVSRNLCHWREKGDPLLEPPTCNTVACFGGWCAWWPAFMAFLVSDGIHDPGLLFGVDWLFAMKDGLSVPDELKENEFTGTDHDLVTYRLLYAFENTKVIV